MSLTMKFNNFMSITKNLQPGGPIQYQAEIARFHAIDTPFS